MELVSCTAGVVAVISTVLMLTRLKVVDALLYMLESLDAVAVVLYARGTLFAAALEAIAYVGAIILLFVFVNMMLDLGERTVETESRWLTTGRWKGPAVLGGILLIMVAQLLGLAEFGGGPVPPTEAGAAMFGLYMIGVELASMLLLAGMAGANHAAVPQTVNPGSRRHQAAVGISYRF